MKAVGEYREAEELYPMKSTFVVATGILRSYGKQILAGLRADESGQDLIEYALVAAFIGLGTVAALGNLTSSIISVFTSVGTSLSSGV